ncbi:MAG: hypothetical protein JWL90_2325 [Chthoniobacteraceae bacterium]|nr:hypothetical protein [Chthoniobacteraceae bacterium]
MRPLFFFSLLILLTGGTALPAERGGALDAIKKLPKGQAKSLVRMVGREGTPAPERWYLLVYDRTVFNGLREYVVAGGEVITSRTISQFADKLTRDEVIGGQAIRVDSGRVAKALQQYASANNVTVSTLNYELRKDGPDAAALWQITGADDSGNELGSVVISAAKGSVISHPGFAVEPGKGKKAVFNTVSDAHLGSDNHRPGFFKRLAASFRKLFGGRNTR